jgi:dipicolinate synthase subunit B
VEGKKIGFALTGSYCTFDAVLPELKRICETGADVTPILSYNTAKTDTRFIKCQDLKNIIRQYTGKDAIETIEDAEPIGPKKLFELLIIAPCTGNTLAKIAGAVTDTPVTMAAKAQLRNERPVLIAVSTNDGLSANAKNLGLLLNTRNIYFVPFRQDNYIKKSSSLVAEMGLIIDAAKSALSGKQLQPIILEGYSS